MTKPPSHVIDAVDAFHRQSEPILETPPDYFTEALSIRWRHIVTCAKEANHPPRASDRFLVEMGAFLWLQTQSDPVLFEQSKQRLCELVLRQCEVDPATLSSQRK